MMHDEKKTKWAIYVLSCVASVLNWVYLGSEGLMTVNIIVLIQCRQEAICKEKQIRGEKPQESK